MASKRLSFFTIFVTFSLLILGGIVHNTQSSLACPDWPLCFGQVFPKMEGGVLIEHSHRLLASLVGLLTIFLVVITRKTRKEHDLYRWSWIALGMVIFQGVLGGITVIYRLPTIVSTTHLGFSMVFFCTMIMIHHKSSLREVSSEFSKHWKKVWNPNVRVALVIAGVLLYLQMMLGAFMRHSGAGAACGLGMGNSLLCYDTTIWKTSFWPALAPAQLHMFHRYLGVIVGIVLFYACGKIHMLLTGLERKEKWQWFWPSFLFPLVVLAQIVLGVLTVAYNMTAVPTTLHLGGAALTLGLVWKQYLQLRQLEDVSITTKSTNILEDIFELTKPKLSGLVVSTALVGMILAPEHINFFHALGALSLIALVVFGAAALNCYIERDVDGLMERTRDRALPAGRLNPRVALVFGVILLAISIPALIYYVNALTGVLALIAAVLYLFAYTPMKRMSDKAVYVGAIPGAIPPLLGWTTVMGEIGAMGWALFLILLVWQVPHFLAISLFHAQDYRRADIKVLPNLYGVQTTKVFIALSTLGLFAVSLLPSVWAGASTVYLNTAIILSGAFLLLSLEGFLRAETTHMRAWARRYFWGSLVYLPLILCAIVFFK